MDASSRCLTEVHRLTPKATGIVRRSWPEALRISLQLEIERPALRQAILGHPPIRSSRIFLGLYEIAKPRPPESRQTFAERKANGAMLLVGWSMGHFPSFPDSAPPFHPNHRKSDAGDRVKSSKLPGGAPYTRAR